MNIVTKLEDWQIIRRQLLAKSIGLVHTMGNLHAGHISLLQASKQMNDVTVAAIFVNPTQFNQVRDFELYPRTLAHDITVLTENKVDYLLLLDEETLYPDHYHIQISENETASMLEGVYRKGHFTGMLTIVLKFLNIVQPARSYYGEKDYQQWLLIKKMSQALFLAIEIIACPTIRDDDGLALSSRNSRLTPSQRKMAAHFPALLQSAENPAQITAKLQALGFSVDYIEEKWQRRLGAVWIDDVRLIDNIPMEVHHVALS
jgi:pantoate--beta-alanine ligase